jgi:hypothetical protein
MIECPSGPHANADPQNAAPSRTASQMAFMDGLREKIESYEIIAPTCDKTTIVR